MTSVPCAAGPAIAPSPPALPATPRPIVQASALLLEKVEKTKLAAVARPRPDRSIRPETDKEVRKPTGPSRTVDNISLRCWRHNQYEAELIFGPHGQSIVPGAHQPFDHP